MKFIKSKKNECSVDNVNFKIYKFNARSKPLNKKNINIFTCFSEFGCETVGVMYCIPQLLKENAGKYNIVVGWQGRSFLYRHLVDEFWELDESLQHLREHCRAFHHISKDLIKLENKLRDYGRVFNHNDLGAVLIADRCNSCNSPTKNSFCTNCKSVDIKPALIKRVEEAKSEIKKVPHPTPEKIEYSKKYIQDNMVGIFARGRKCYGRNLQPEFYIKLIDYLKNRGYSVIWLGEKASTQPCPVSDVLDFSRMDESRDLELTLAIISQLKFTIQFWTASTRLASMMGVPYLLFESPDQIWGRGQEGIRRNLCDLGPSKLVVSHYLSVYENHDQGLKYVDQAITEMEKGNFDDVFGILETDCVAQAMKEKFYKDRQ